MSIYAITGVYYVKPIDASNGARFEQKTIKNNVASGLFHEFGHVIYKGSTQDHVIDYENKARKQTGLPEGHMMKHTIKQ